MSLQDQSTEFQESLKGIFVSGQKKFFWANILFGK